MDFRALYPGDDVRVLLVEDNPADAALVRRMLEDSSMRHQLTTLRDGVEALGYLRREYPYRDARSPDIVLLDLNLPRKSGMEVLEEIKTDSLLKIIPVIILSSSEAANDIRESYRLGANAYLKKSLTLDSMFDLVHTMQHFWMDLAALPLRADAVSAG